MTRRDPLKMARVPGFEPGAYRLGGESHACHPLPCAHRLTFDQGLLLIDGGVRELWSSGIG